jgi:hypothetical protein
MYHRVPEVGEWLSSVVARHDRYYGGPMNGSAFRRVQFEVVPLWHRAGPWRS